MPSVLWRCWLGGRKGIRPVKTEWWGAGMVICVERGADLHMAYLMPLPLTVSCFSKIQIGFTFLVLAHPGSPGQRAVKCVCVLCCFFQHETAELSSDSCCCYEPCSFLSVCQIWLSAVVYSQHVVLLGTGFRNVLRLAWYLAVVISFTGVAARHVSATPAVRSSFFCPPKMLSSISYTIRRLAHLVINRPLIFVQPELNSHI